MNPASAPAALPLMQMIVALIAVLAVIVGMAWAARRLQRGGVGGRASLMRTHASINVGPRERAVLIEAGGCFLLLGVASGSVRLLHRFEQAPEIPEQDSLAGGEFVARLRDALRQRK